MNRIAAALALGLASVLGGCAAYADAPIASMTVAQQREPVTILVSIDGFHPDYLERGLTPTLSQISMHTGLVLCNTSLNLRKSKVGHHSRY